MVALVTSDKALDVPTVKTAVETARGFVKVHFRGDAIEFCFRRKAT